MDYQWLVIAGGILSFSMSWGIGANDVANSFATSIGAKTITLFQACCIAACLEFLGAMTLGGEVSKTIASSIADIKNFDTRPEVFAYGMMCSLLSATIWVAFASYKGLAVSTTHSIIGSVIGFVLVWGGSDAIIWYKPSQDFPYVQGIVPIIVSWFTSPLMSSILSIIIFLGNRHLILRKKNNTTTLYIGIPFLVFVTIFINLFFVLYKGAKAELHWEPNQAAWVSAITASGCSIISIPFIRWINKKNKNEIQTATIVDETIITENRLQAIYNNFNNHAIIHLDNDITSTTTIEKFSDEIEYIYKYLQVFSSCCVAFAHGANDVANSIGPYAAIWHVYNNNSIVPNIMVPKWMLALGGGGIVIGLWTYGYKVIQSLGGQLCKLSPSRGYSAELATALTVSFASVYGIPISTTHCIVGAEVGIGIVENIHHGVNWKLFGKTVTAWIFTIIITALVSAILFSQGIYAPSKIK